MIASVQQTTLMQMVLGIFRVLARSRILRIIAIVVFGVHLPLPEAHAAPIPLGAIPFCVDSSGAIVDNGSPGNLCIGVIPDVSPGGFLPGNDPIEYAVTLPLETHLELFPVASDSADVALGAVLFGFIGEAENLVLLDGNLSGHDDETIPGTDFSAQIEIGSGPADSFHIVGFDIPLLIPIDGCVELSETWVCSQSFPIFDNTDFRDGLLLHDVHFSIGCDLLVGDCAPFLAQPLGVFFYRQSLLEGSARHVGVVDSKFSISEPASVSLLGLSLAVFGLSTRTTRRPTGPIH